MKETEPGHAEGPWAARKTGDAQVEGGDNYQIEEAYHPQAKPIAILIHHWRPDLETAANARLIAAAPALLVACRAILARLDAEAKEVGESTVFIGNALRATLRAAIQRAEGKQEVTP